jgi:hypothetical protein
MFNEYFSLFAGDRRDDREELWSQVIGYLPPATVTVIAFVARHHVTALLPCLPLLANVDDVSVVVVEDCARRGFEQSSFTGRERLNILHEHVVAQDPETHRLRRPVDRLFLRRDSRGRRRQFEEFETPFSQNDRPVNIYLWK